MYQSFDKDDAAKAAKAVALQHLATNGNVSEAIKVAAALHWQTANSWLKKLQRETSTNANKDDPSTANKDGLGAAFDRSEAGNDQANKKWGLLSEADQEFLQSMIKARNERNE